MLRGGGGLLSKVQHCGGSALLRSRHCAPAPKHQRTIRMPAACRPVLLVVTCLLLGACSRPYLQSLLPLRFRAAQEMKELLGCEAPQAQVQQSRCTGRCLATTRFSSRTAGNLTLWCPALRTPAHSPALRLRSPTARSAGPPTVRLECIFSMQACLQRVQLKAFQAAAQARAAGLTSQRQLGRPRWRTAFLVRKVTLSSLSVAGPQRRVLPCSHAAHTAAAPAPLLANTSPCRVSPHPESPFSSDSLLQTLHSRPPACTLA
jgi:hypothetical protein